MGRVALVTGGTRGIGEGISKALKSAGYTVAASYAGNDEAAKKFSEETGIATYKFDVADFEQCTENVQRIESDNGPVDILVNNAGITRDAALHKMTWEKWDAVIQTDLSSCFNMSRAVIEGMRSRAFGRIINISSINGEAGQFGQTNYSSAKAGMIGFTKALAREVRRQRHNGQRHRTGLHSHGDGPRRPRGHSAEDHQDHSSRTPGRSGRDRPVRAFPGCGRCRVYHRIDHRRQRWSVYSLMCGRVAPSRNETSIPRKVHQG